MYILVSLISGKSSRGILKYAEIPKIRIKKIATYIVVLFDMAHEDSLNSLSVFLILVISLWSLDVSLWFGLNILIKL